MFIQERMHEGPLINFTHPHLALITTATVVAVPGDEIKLLKYAFGSHTAPHLYFLGTDMRVDSKLYKNQVSPR